MRINKIAIFICLTVSSLLVFSQAKPFRMGYTNVDYLISLHPDTKKVDEELKKYRAGLDKEAEALYKEFQEKYAAYQKGSAMMSEPTRLGKEKELGDLQERIQDFQRNAEADLQKKQIDLLQPVLDKIQKAIDAVAEENGFTYIFNSDAGYGTTPVLLHGPEKDNITDLVLKKLGIVPPPPGQKAGNTISKPATKPAPATKKP